MPYQVIKDIKLDKYLGFARKLKKAMEHKEDSDTNSSQSPWNNPKDPEKRVRELEILRKI